MNWAAPSGSLCKTRSAIKCRRWMSKKPSKNTAHCIKPSRPDLWRPAMIAPTAGLGIALIETAFAGGLGMNIDLTNVPYHGKKRNDYILFSETASRFVVTIHPQDKSKFEKIMAGNVVSEIGFVSGRRAFSDHGTFRQTDY